MENRGQRLEQIRQESIRAWQEARLNEAKEIGISKNAQGLGINGLGAGGSSVSTSYTDPVEFIWVLFTDDNNSYAYTQFSLETNTWTDPFSFNISKSIYIDYVYRTNGYGTGFEFQNDAGGSDTILCYVDSKGELAWSSGPVEWSSYDVDTETAIGLVSFFMKRNNTTFEIKTFYRDIENTFTFDNYQGTTSANINNRLYGHKCLYRFGDVTQGNMALYALDVLTGVKTLLYEQPSVNIYFDYIDLGYTDSVYENIPFLLSKIGIISYDNDNGQLEEIKVIDFEGNVVHNVAAQFGQQGFDITNINLYNGGSYTTFGKYELTKSSDDAYMYIKQTTIGITTILYFGFKEGAIWYKDDFVEPLYVITPLNGNNLFIAYSSESAIAQVGDMLVGDTGPINIDSISPTGPMSTALDTLTYNLSMVGNEMYTWTISGGELFFFTWNTVTGDTSFESAAPGELYVPGDDVYYSYLNIVLGNLECFLNAYSAASGLWSAVYRNSVASAPTVLASSVAPFNYYANINQNLPTLLQKTDTSDISRINQSGNDLTLIMLSCNSVSSSNGDTWKYNSKTWAIGNNSTGTVYFVSPTSITEIAIPAEEVTFTNGYNPDNKFIIEGSNGVVYFFTENGFYLSAVDPAGGFYTLYSSTMYWEDGATAYIYNGEMYLNILGTTIDRISQNDEWF